MKEEPNYYAIIPANVRYDKSLTPRAILLYGEISALCNKYGFCWATNNYFAELYGVSKTSVSKWISELEVNNYIVTLIEYKDGSSQVDKRYIAIAPPIKENLKGALKENLKRAIEENLKGNNTSTFNTTSGKGATGKIPPLFPELDKDFKSMFKNSTVGNIITFKEQFKEPEFKVIDLDYYFSSVENWNEIKRVTRTARGWIATAKNFMKSDNEKNKLKTIGGTHEILSQEQIDYLKL